jgi:hypothetical protein
MSGSFGDTAKGAAGGALAGASIGGPLGALVGGVGGGALAYFGGGENEQDSAQRKRLEELYAQMGMPPPQAGPAAQSGYSNFRSNQSDLVGRLEAMSKGQGPSLAAQQFQQATDRNMASQQSMAQSGRGGPLAAFNAANNMGHLGAQAAQGAAQARIQEQQMALNQLGLTLHGARGADEATNQFNANEQNQMSGMNLDAKLRAMGMDNEMRLRILAQMGGQNAQAHGPQLGDQIMVGGAGMYGMYQSQQAANRLGSLQGPPVPQGPITSPTQQGWQGHPQIPYRPQV